MQVMTKPYAENKTVIYLENTFLDRKAEKIGFGLQATPFYCIFFLLSSINLEQNNPILTNTSKFNAQFYNSFCSLLCLPLYCISGFFSLLTIPLPLPMYFLCSFSISWLSYSSVANELSLMWKALISISNNWKKNKKTQSNQAMHTAHLCNHLVSSGVPTPTLLLFSYVYILHFLLNYPRSPLGHRLLCYNAAHCHHNPVWGLWTLL